MFKVSITIWIGGSKGITSERKLEFNNFVAATVGYRKAVAATATTVCTIDKGYGLVQLSDPIGTKFLEFSCHGSNDTNPYNHVEVN